MELTSWTSRLKAVEQKYDRLPHLSSVIGRDVLKNDQKTIETESATDGSPKLSALFFLLERKGVESLQPIDQFLGYLKKSGDKRHQKERNQLARRLQKRTDYRQAVGALFEIEILICLLKNNSQGSVNLYPQIRNNNFSEASVTLGKKTVYLEATLLSQTENQESIWDIGHKQSKPSQKEIESLGISNVRHHPSFSILVGGSDPYRDALRLTTKIESKRRQLAGRSPNILCIGLPDIDPNPSSVKWGIDAAFSGDLKSAQSVIWRQKSRLSNDQNLSDVEIQQIEQDIWKLEQWGKTFKSEPRLTGVLVFRWERSDFQPENHFLNPSPHPESQVSGAEWQTILDWFGFSKTSDSTENEKSLLQKKTYKLADMLAQVTADNLHPELDTRSTQGNEEW